MTFFKPRAKFIEWLKAYAKGRTIVDAGCGDGLLTKMLWEAGYERVIPVDPAARARDMLIPVIQVLTAELYQVRYVRDVSALVVTARPDHGGWVKEIPTYMHEGSELLYIGLAQNVTRDLGELTYESVRAKGLPNGTVVRSVRGRQVEPLNSGDLALAMTRNT